MKTLQVKFASSASARPVSNCRVCGEGGGLHVLDVQGPMGELRAFSCPACRSLFFDGADPAKRYTELDFTDEFWIDYVQAGAGISSLLTPILAMKRRLAGRLLDVGCGFGYVVDYWNKRCGSALGLEPSEYGEVGRTKLGVDIRADYLGEFLSTYDGPKFDVVFSSEVIEHTPDPDAFVGELTEAVSDNGVIVLTTPSVSVIRPDADESRVIAALSPGFHYALIHDDALKGFFTSRGFHCRTMTLGVQLLCWASRKPLPAIDIDRFDWDDYLDYLGDLADNDDPHVATGALSRLFKDALNTGRPAVAAPAYQRLKRAALAHFRIDLENPEIGDILAMTRPLSGLKRFPSWLGPALLFGGLHVGHAMNDRRTKVRMLDASLKVLEHRATVDHQFGQEAAHFLPFAKRQYVIGLSEALTTSLFERPNPAAADLEQTLSALGRQLTERISVGTKVGKTHDLRYGKRRPWPRLYPWVERWRGAGRGLPID